MCLVRQIAGQKTRVQNNKKLLMLIKSLSAVEAFRAGDHTWLKEVIHPHKDAVDLPYSLAWASLQSGEASLPHVLQSEELYLFLEGEGRFFQEKEERPVKKGDVLLVPAGTRQYLKNTGPGPLEFFCLVSPPWREEGEEVERQSK